jgi:Ni/Co efflux regulator RcnB
MKKFILSAVAATLVAAPIMAAAPADAAQRRQTTVVRHDDRGRKVVTHRTVTRTPTYHRWAKGQRFDRRHARNYRVVTNYRSYHRLYNPPRGYHWVRSGNDAVLVAVTSGLIGAVIGGAFN